MGIKFRLCAANMDTSRPFIAPKLEESVSVPEPEPPGNPPGFAVPDQPLSPSIEDKIKAFIEDNKKLWGRRNALLRFWRPIKITHGRTVFTASEQPFWVDPLSSSLVKYANSSLHHQYLLEGGEDQLGPIGRAFIQKSPEYCPDIKCYNNLEFPLRNLVSDSWPRYHYWALPLREDNAQQQQQQQQQQRCFGVIECVIEIPLSSSKIKHALELVNLACLGLHPDKCYQSRLDNLWFSQIPIEGVLKSVRDNHQLPLILVWVPCMCKASVEADKNTSSCSKAAANGVTKLFPHSAVLDEKMRYAADIKRITSDPTCFVTDEKGLVGKAYSRNQLCHSKDTRELRLSDSPLLPLTRASGLTAAFAFPLQLIHLKLPPLIVELYPPSTKCFNAFQLKSILTIMAQKIYYKLIQKEKIRVVRSCSRTCSDGYRIVYYNVPRWGILNLPKVLGRERESSSDEAKNLSLSSDDEDKNSGNLYADTNIKITLEDLKQQSGKKLEEAAVALGVTQPTLKRKCEELGISWESWEPLPKRNREAADVQHREEGETECSYAIVVKAVYRDDIAKFPLRSNSGIKELQEDLDKRFDFKDEKLKIKYEDEEGEWIILSCDEDVWFHMKNLKISGHTTMRLSVFPVTW